MPNNLPVSARSTGLAKRTYPNAVAEYEDRLSEAEALAIVGILLGQFPNCKGDDLFQDQLAIVLRSYPRSVALACADANRGVAAFNQFLGISAVKSWCEQQGRSIEYAADWEARARRTMETREEPKLISDSARQKCQDWINRIDPKARQMNPDPSPNAEMMLQRERRKMNETNQRRAHEYRTYGLEPVYANPEKTIVTSLPMLLSKGWRIEQVNGDAILVGP